jgi:hypothetical protein
MNNALFIAIGTYRAKIDRVMEQLLSHDVPPKQAAWTGRMA